MESVPSQINVQELVSWVRDFIQHPRRLGPLIEDEPGWNVLTSAMDLIPIPKKPLRAIWRIALGWKGESFAMYPEPLRIWKSR
jgi:hypothetical protein